MSWEVERLNGDDDDLFDSYVMRRDEDRKGLRLGMGKLTPGAEAPCFVERVERAKPEGLAYLEAEVCRLRRGRLRVRLGWEEDGVPGDWGMPA